METSLQNSWSVASLNRLLNPRFLQIATLFPIIQWRKTQPQHRWELYMTVVVISLQPNPALMIVYILGHPSSMTYVLYSLGFELTRSVSLLTLRRPSFIHIWLKRTEITPTLYGYHNLPILSEFLIYRFKVMLFGSVSALMNSCLYWWLYRS